MNFRSNNTEADVLRRKYRKLLQEAERLASVNKELARSYYAEADKVINKLTLLRRRMQFH